MDLSLFFPFLVALSHLEKDITLCFENVLKHHNVIHTSESTIACQDEAFSVPSILYSLEVYLNCYLHLLCSN